MSWIDPIAALAPFATDDCVVLFDSGGGGARGRYSYLCVEPFCVLRVQDGEVAVDGVPATGDGFAVLALLLKTHARPSQAGARAPFTGGAAGYIGYDMGAALERVPRAPGSVAGVPDMLIGFFDVVFVFDHAARTVVLCAPDAARGEAVMARVRDAGAPGAVAGLVWRAMVPAEVHMARVRAVLSYIAAGDIYQANLTAGFEAVRPAGLDLAALYGTVRKSSPAPFGVYVGCGGGCAVISASPERFLRLGADGVVETRPIKGTRARGVDAAADAALAADLLGSEKDRAENLMIVDLLRNDLARVADAVRVPSLLALESFAHVHHLVSVVEGRMMAGLGAVDVVRAAFPGGSITGAPKVRAMEIIAELEGLARGAYCGSALWIGWDGAMDSNILIRTLVVGRDRVVAQAGGGIVADSDPAEEWGELLVKIMPVLRATGMVFS